VVVDADGNPVVGIPVTFTTTAGTLNPGTAPTDSTGRASTTLTTSATAQVTATAGTVASSALTINAATKPVASVTATTTSPSVGQVVGFTVSVTPATSGSSQVPLRSVTINFGDGGSQSLGTNTSQSTTHTYSTAGTYVVTATVTDVNGETGSGSTSIQVLPLLASLGASPQTGAPPLTVAFTLTLTPSTVAVQSVDWDYGDGELEPNSATLTKSHIYTRSGTWNAVATAHLVGGSTIKGNIQIKVGS
jgi:PKD repeat protein